MGEGGGYQSVFKLYFPSFFHEKKIKAVDQIYFLTKTQEAKKEEDLGLHTQVAETRTNLCSFTRRIIKVGSKLDKLQPKRHVQLENGRPLF